MVRLAFANDAPAEEKQYAKDYFMYLWCGPDSCLFDKAKMATFERYFLAEKETHVEEKGWLFKLREQEKTADTILDAFGVEGPNRHIINGHVPVHVKKGETPIKANGKLMVIDGGFAEPYHKETGIAGYTLIYNSHGIQLVEHESFESREQAILSGSDIHNRMLLQDFSGQRIRIKDTDKGKELLEQIEALEQLLEKYRDGSFRQAL